MTTNEFILNAAWAWFRAAQAHELAHETSDQAVGCDCGPRLEARRLAEAALFAVMTQVDQVLAAAREG